MAYQETVLPARDSSSELRWTAPNLLLSTLFVAVSLPCGQAECAMPQVRPQARQLTALSDVRKTFFTDLTPANQYDWPNPRLAIRDARPFAIDGRMTPDASTSANLTQQTTFIYGPRRIVPFEPPNLLITTLAPVATPSPFTPLAWPNPSRAVVAPITQREPPNLLAMTLAPAVLAAPFTQTEWPNPLTRDRAPITQRTFVFYYVYDDTAPFTPQEWPNPIGKTPHRELRTWTQSPAQVPPIKPFLQSEWPLATGKPFPISLRTWIDWRELMLADLVPAHLTEWPNPRGKAYPTFLRTFTTGEWAPIRPIIVLAADACNTFHIGADDILTVAADDGAFSVPAASQSFDVEGCE